MNIGDIFKTIFDYKRSLETTMRIGEALELLQKLPKDFNIKISMEWINGFKDYYDTLDDKEYAETRKNEYDGMQMYFDGTFDSDRGDYANMYIGYTYDETTFTVQNLIDLLLKAKEQGVMFGYKGGEFQINDNTLLTIARYGFSEGIRPTGFELKDDYVLMKTKYEE